MLLSRSPSPVTVGLVAPGADTLTVVVFRLASPSPAFLLVPFRCATACLLTFLAMAFPKYALLFQFLITLDFSSHYMHMYRSVSVPRPPRPRPPAVRRELAVSPAELRPNSS